MRIFLIRGTLLHAMKEMPVSETQENQSYSDTMNGSAVRPTTVIQLMLSLQLLKVSVNIIIIINMLMIICVQFLMDSKLV